MKDNIVFMFITMFIALITILIVLAFIGAELVLTHMISYGNIILVMQLFTIIYLGVVYYVVASKYLRKNTQRMI